MTRPHQPLRVGLSGGIASGKSTVGGFLSDCGACVIDADQLAHQALEPGLPAYIGAVNRFGDGILDASRRIDRAKLAACVFTQPDQLQALNDIVHPVVQAEADRLYTECIGAGQVGMVVFEAALLVETGRYREQDSLIIVSCSKDTQLRRLRKRGMSETDALARIGSQASLEEKLSVADHVINTEGPLDETRRQTAAIYAKLL
jgi:dephospho-CoA kinase